MQISRRRAAARQDERPQWRELVVEAVDLALEPLHLLVGDGEPRTARAFLREAEIGLDVEQIVLDARQHGVEIRHG